jgi:hypothetical protein
MSENRRTGLFIAALFAAGAVATPVMAQSSGQRLASTDPDAQHVLTLMDQARSGKVSQQEYMTAQAAEYARLAGAQASSVATQPPIRLSSAPHR